MDTYTGTLVNGYQFLEQIGTGGFAVVYRAAQPALGRDVAIKIILPAHAGQPDFFRRFEREARLIARLEHPHIVPLYDYWQDANGAFLVMRWLPATVRGTLQQNPYSPTAAADLLDQVASALHTAHRSGVIHRDIKPDNLLLDTEGNVYLADFGIAKADSAEITDSTGQIIGSMAYIAPEQIAGEIVTVHADIYSLGLVMYELLTGIQPYQSESISELLHRHLHEPLPSIRAQKPELPAALDAVIALACAKQPEARYTDAMHFARAFRAALPGPRHVQPLSEPLTDREREILQLMSDGLTNQEIAERLYVAASTVKWYKKQIYSKLDVHNQDLAIAYAKTLGLLSAPTVTGKTQAPVVHTAMTAMVSVPATAAALRLPSQTTPFVGRETEIAALLTLLREPNTRLITILAPGGMGKTRLALEIAAQAAGTFKHGAAFIPLNAVSDATQVISTIANALGIVLSAQMEPKQQLLEHFRLQHKLLILDNFEHVIEVAPLLMDMLSAAPLLRILTTTRERLNLSAERVFPLGGMDLPEASSTDDPLSYSAVRLFMSTANPSRASTYTRADLAQVGAICRLVEGMPLAILLAASWSDLLNPHEIADELQRGIDFLESQWRDAPERQRSIRAVFDASWKRLTAAETEVLMKLSVFRGGFTRRAAEKVAGASLRTLSGLVNKAMLWMDQEGRCTIHELLRQYAGEHLHTAGDYEALSSAHSQYYLEALTAHESALIGPNQVIATQTVGVDFENVRAAFLWGIAAQDYPRLAAAVHPLWLYASYSGRHADVVTVFDRVAESLRRAFPAPMRDTLLADVLCHQAHLLISMIDRPRADQCLAEAAPLIETSQDPRLRAFYHLTCAYWLPWEDISRTLSNSRQALDGYRSVGDRWGEMMSLIAMANTQLGKQDPDPEITASLQQALTILDSMGDPYDYSRALTQAALVLPVDAEHSAERLSLLQQIVDLRRHANPVVLASALGNHALTQVALGRLVEAAQELEEAVAIRRAQGNIRNLVGFDDLGETYLRLGRLAEAEAVYQEAYGNADRTGQQVWRNYLRLFLAYVAYAEGNNHRVEELAAKMLEENTAETPFDAHGTLTCAFVAAGLAALANGDDPAARRWCEQAALANQRDGNRNARMLIQVAVGLLTLRSGSSEAAHHQLTEAATYFLNNYESEMLSWWERDFGVALALTGASRAAIRSGQPAEARSLVVQALQYAAKVNVEALALMACIPAAEIALAAGNAEQAAQLAGLAARHPHTFAADRAEAELLLKQLPDAADDESDLWELVEERGGKQR